MAPNEVRISRFSIPMFTVIYIKNQWQLNRKKICSSGVNMHSPGGL